ncbi:MAG: 2,3-bisphosphoglycerate-independent phosphoglycerate mutase [Candidatus Margulisiibacteriota bacterium]
MRPKPLVLIIMDGWGIRAKRDANAIALAGTPNLDALTKKYPSTQLGCSGEDVGLPEGQMGNSEVGHLNIGAGRVVYQELTRISKAIRDGEFFKNPEFLKAIETVKKNNSSLHLMGLLSDGGVHSEMTHLYALLQLAKQQGIKKVYIHALLDGRDTPPRSALTYFEQLENKFKEIGVGQVATVAGRYYTMDRDKRWDRVQKGYDALTRGIGQEASSAEAAVENAYARGENDEFVLPTVIMDGGVPRAVVKDGDAFIFFNFRADRARQISYAFTDPNFNGFPRSVWPKVHYVCMCQYDIKINAPVAFPPQNLKNILAEVISNAGLRQVHIAETEKYAHVTFFFNGGVEKPFPGEDRILVSSPKVATYDLQPEMSAPEVTEKVLAAIASDKYDVVIMNYANGDMVGHTGILAAAEIAVKTVDLCVGKVAAAVLEKSGVVLITADHGNAELMQDEVTGQPYTAHTTNPVPFILAGGADGTKLHPGILADIAPTILKLLGLKIPSEMTGRVLFEEQ